MPLTAMGDIDISLRSIAATMPEDLSGALFPGARVEVRGWRESQLTQMERRVDELLELLVDGALVLLHVEWQLAWARDVLERAYTYQSMAVLAQLQRLAAQRAEAAAQRAARERDVPAPDDTLTPVESAVVLLSGRREPWEMELPFRTSRAEASFSGVQVRVVAVYQRTVAELLAMPGRLWLVFAPIAADASPEGVGEVMAAVKRRARTRDELGDLLATMSLVAESRGAIEAIQEMLMKAMDEEGVTFTSKLYRRGRDDGMRPLLRQLERKLARPLSEAERAVLGRHLERQGPDHVGDVALDLDGPALAVWLADPAA